MQADSARHKRNGHRRVLQLRSHSVMDGGEWTDLRATLDDIQAQADLAARAIAKLADVARAGFACSCTPAARRLVCLNDLVVEVLRRSATRAGRATGYPARSISSPSVAGTRSLRACCTLLVPPFRARSRRRRNPITVHVSGRGVLQGAYRPRRVGRCRRADTAGGTLTMDEGRTPAPSRYPWRAASSTSTTVSCPRRPPSLRFGSRSSCPRSRTPTPHEDPGGRRFGHDAADHQEPAEASRIREVDEAGNGAKR